MRGSGDEKQNCRRAGEAITKLLRAYRVQNSGKRPQEIELMRELAAALPKELKRLRGLMMLETMAAQLGVSERACPACQGSGWEDEGAGEKCPLCLGFREVPARIAQLARVVLKAGRLPKRLKALKPRPIIPNIHRVSADLEQWDEDEGLL